jgi:ribosome-associated protein
MNTSISFTTKDQSIPNSTQALLKKILEILDDKKADDVIALNITHASDVLDYLVVASGKSSPHVRTLFSYLKSEIRHGFEIQPLWQSDRENSWIAIDFGSIMVHLFEPSRRAFYNLEGLWSQKSSS